jgi:hypothetical protein
MTLWQKMKSPLSKTTVHNIVVGILCILLACSLIALYRRIKCGSLSVLEGMTTDNAAGLDPAVASLQAQTAALQTTYDKLTIASNDQKNRIDANAHMLMKVISDPNQSSNVTNVSINADNPSETKIPSIDMS